MTPRRLLLPCYYFPPVPSVGSVRVGALAKYLPEHGWQVTVVTPARDGRRTSQVDVVETPDADRAAALKRWLGLRPELALKDQIGAAANAPSRGARLRAALVEAAKVVLAFPDANRGWASHGVAAARRLVEDRRFDAVLTSSPPVSVHLAGRRIASGCGIPWVADLRDLWSQDHNSTAPDWRRRLERRLERRTFRAAAGLVTVSEPLRRELQQLHPQLPTHTILNGFDPELERLTERLSPTFSICHTGTFYQGRRDPTPLFEALGGLLAAGRIDRSRVRVRLLSRREPWLERLVERCGLGDVVALESWVPWETALRVQQESQILLLLHWGGPAEVGVYTGKIFEYLAARRPILMVGGGEGVLSELLRETGAGVHTRDRAAIERQLLEWWRAFERGGAVPFRGDERQLARFSHRRMAAEFAAVLAAAADGGRNARGARHPSAR